MQFAYKKGKPPQGRGHYLVYTGDCNSEVILFRTLTNKWCYALPPFKAFKEWDKIAFWAELPHPADYPPQE